MMLSFLPKSWFPSRALFPVLALLFLVFTAVSLHLRPPIAHAATISVNTVEDELNSDGDCSLREAIQAANSDGAVDACPSGSGDDIVTLPAGTYILTLAGANEDSNSTGDLDIADNLAINGAGVGDTTINGGGIDRVLHLFSGTTVEINDLTITNGSTTLWGGGIFNAGGTLTLNNSSVSNNSAGGSGAGGGILNNSGTVTLNNSSVVGNTADYGGGIHNIWASAMLTLNNSTVSGNAADGNGGGISNDQYGRVILTNSTISGNSTTAGNGGGIYSLYGTLTLNNVTISDNSTQTGDGGGMDNGVSTVNLRNSIIANNSDGGGEAPDCTGVFASIDSQGYNIIGNENGCVFTATVGDQVGVDPLLGLLQNNGGNTLTHALLTGSPAIDAGNPATPGSGGVACEVTDQRGEWRPMDGNNDGIEIYCDIGAYEAPGTVAPTPTPSYTPVPSSTPSSTPVPPAATPSHFLYLPLICKP
jgi:CSLREA domain-containing protein